MTRAAEQEIHVWIVLDDAPLRGTVRDILEQRPGMRCTLAAESCEEALAALRRGCMPQVVLMDLAPPGTSGADGIARIAAISPASQIVVLTNHDDDGRIFQALCAGACGYLLEPAPGEQIIGAVETAARGGAPMSPPIARKVLQMLTQAARAGSAHGLTGREREVLQFLVEARSQKQIAHALGLSPHTVGTHLRKIYAKLQVHSRSGAVARALRERLL
jgi:DNA-binding NarL/FixJ family response regulator